MTDSAEGYVTVAIGDDIYAADDEDEASYEIPSSAAISRNSL